MNGVGNSAVILRRAAGCLVGVAVGDALGGPVEGYPEGEIIRRFHRLTEMVGGGSKNLAAGETSDDTAQTLIMAESITACNELDPADVARRLARWYEQNGFGIGLHTANVLARIADGQDWEQAALETQAARPESAGNGSLMRCAPVALLHHSKNDVLIKESRLSSRITHPHSDCQCACAFVNLVIAALLSGTQKERAVDRAINYCINLDGFSDSVIERAERARSSMGARVLIPSGHVLDSLECSLWALLHHQSLEETLVAAINLGGDADTIGSISGSLAGAAYGIDEIPARWLVYVSDRLHLQYLAHTIVGLH